MGAALQVSRHHQMGICATPPPNLFNRVLQVHQSCLKRWVDEKEKSGHSGKVVCPQCQTEYIIVFPNMGLFVLLLDTVDGIVFRGSLFLAAGIAASAIYWTGVTYGAITVMQVPLDTSPNKTNSPLFVSSGHRTQGRDRHDGAG